MKYKASEINFLLACLSFLLVSYLVQDVVLAGQESYIRFDHISSEQGFSLSVVYSILQERRGFMWFGTQNGLIRYDGYTFKEYKKNPRDSLSLSSNIVRVIYEDRSGNLWVGTEGGGLSRFNREKENFTRFRYQNHMDPNPDPDIDIILTIYEDRNEVFYLGTFGGLLCFDPKKQKWSRFVHDPGNPGTLRNNRIRAFCEDHTGIMWIGTDGGGVNTFDPKTGTFSYFLHTADNPDSLSDNRVCAIYEDSARNLWVGTFRGLDRFDRDTKTFVHYILQSEEPGSPDNNIIRTIFEDSKQRLWIGGTLGSGLNQMKSFSEGTFYSYRHQPYNPHSLSHNTVYSIMEDRTGCIWIGTFGGGINRIDRQKQQFSHFRSEPYETNSLSSNDINRIYEDSNGILWIGTYDRGLNRYDAKTGKFKVYKHIDNEPNSLSNNTVLAIHEDNDDVLWIGTWGGGINCFNPDTESFSHYKHIPGSNRGPGSNEIFSFYEDADNNLWIGTLKGGLNLYLRETREFVHYKHDPRNPGSISSNGVNPIYADQENKEFLWVGTTNSGLECFNRQTQSFKHYPHEPGNPNSLSHNSVLSIYISPHHPGIVWVGTVGGGLNRFHQPTGKWRPYTDEDGLPDNTIYGILEDSHNNLWLSTMKGISRFNQETGEFTNFYAEDGLQHNEFNQGAFYKGRDGRFYFGGINGFNAFFPENILQNKNIPPVVITAFKVHGRENSPLEKSILETTEITLSHKDVFYFEFAALDYTAPAKNQYACILEGQHDDWVQLNYKRDITFTAVPPGRYTFRVRGSNNHGVWNKEGTSIKLIINPPFWKTWWFTVLLVLSIFGMLFVMYKLRVRRYKIQRKNLEIEVAKRTQEISHQKEIIEEKNTQLEVSNRELKNSERELRELNATKDKFFSIISHDLRNHLTALLGFSDMLNRSYQKFDDEKKHKYTRSIDQAAKDLYDLLENLLQWARTQTDVLECKPRTFDLGVLIPEIISTYSINAKKKNINLSWQINKKTYAYADKNMVRTVMRNLISNAIKFTDKDGDIRVTANGKDGFVEVSVLDTGVGISSEKKNTLFKIGKARSTMGTAKEKGTGLGLVICKEFVEKNNGRIWFESPIPDGSKRGSVFRFTLPLSGTSDQEG